MKMPKHPKDQLILAAKVNGLGAAGMNPWHLKASYQMFDADGQPKGQGTFEEWWAGPKKYKISYADPDFHQVLYRNGMKTWTIGDAGVPPFPEWMVWRAFNHPLPKVDLVKDRSFLHFKRKFGSVRLICIQPSDALSDQPVGAGQAAIEIHQYDGIGDGGFANADLSMVCLDPKSPMVRLEALEVGWLNILFNQVVEASGHYLAEQIDVKNADVSVVQAHVESVEFPAAIPDAELAPPANAAPLLTEDSGKVDLGLRVLDKDNGQILYPSEAEKAHIQGLAIVEGTITTTGTISNLKLISGTPILGNSALESVKTWRFKPTRLDGRPVEVHTLVDISYRLGY